MYQFINVKSDKNTYQGHDYDNRKLLVYTDAESKGLICGDNTDTLTMKTMDFEITLRQRGYKVDQLPGSAFKPEFDRNGKVIDFVLIDENGEVQ